MAVRRRRITMYCVGRSAFKALPLRPHHEAMKRRIRSLFCRCRKRARPRPRSLRDREQEHRQATRRLEGRRKLLARQCEDLATAEPHWKKTKAALAAICPPRILLAMDASIRASQLRLQKDLANIDRQLMDCTETGREIWRRRLEAVLASRRTAFPCAAPIARSLLSCFTIGEASSWLCISKTGWGSVCSDLIKERRKAKERRRATLMLVLPPSQSDGASLSFEQQVDRQLIEPYSGLFTLQRLAAGFPAVFSRRVEEASVLRYFGKTGMGYDHFLCVVLGHHACGEVGPAHPTGPSGFWAVRVISRSRTTGRLYRGIVLCKGRRMATGTATATDHGPPAGYAFRTPHGRRGPLVVK